MAFMLGSFTSGLFGGARSAFDLVNDWDALKSKKDMRDAAGAVRDAMKITGGSSDTTLPSVTDTGAARPSGEIMRPDLNTMPQPSFMRSALSEDVPRPERKPEPPPEKQTSVAQAQQAALPVPRTAAPSYLPPDAGAAYTPMSRPPTLTAQPSALPTMIGGGGLPTISYPGGTPAPVDQGARAAIPPAPVDQGARAAIPPEAPTSSLGQQIMRALSNYQPM